MSHLQPKFIATSKMKMISTKTHDKRKPFIRTKEQERHFALHIAQKRIEQTMRVWKENVEAFIRKIEESKKKANSF